MSLGNPQNCLICQFKDYRVIFSYEEPDQYEVAVGIDKEGYFRKWVQCKQCGFYYSLYSRDEGIINKIYTFLYRNTKLPWRKESIEELFQRVVNLPEGKSETKFRVKWLKENINNIWQKGLRKQPSPPYNFLDIGGGNGIFAYEFQDANWLAHVIDPNKDSSFIKTKLDIPLVQDYYKPNSFNHKFDLISLIYVLEHLSDPVSLLKSLDSDMTKNSFLFIEVPDAICFQNKPAQDDIFNSCHLWMFGPNTLNPLLNRCGFEVFCLNRLKTKRGHYALMVIAGKK